MKIGAMNNPHKDLLKEIEWIGKNNFDFLDLTIEYPKAYDFDVDKVKKTLKDFGLDVIGHTAWYLPFAIPIKTVTDVCLKEFEKYLEIFSRIDITSVNIHPNYFTSMLITEEEAIKRNIEFLKKVCKIAKSRGIEIMLENNPKHPADRVNTLDFFKKVFNEVEGLKFHLDVGHANINQEKNLTEDFFRMFSKKLVHIHLSDNWGSNDDHMPLGAGNINWLEIIKILKKYNYDKTITLEIFSPDKDYVLISREKLLKWWREIK